ncbi:MAG: MFS transporter [Candidatus Omnitrophica bacterium]|nr:MFS transporter [Candidatus Omnitrophota bacterium]MBU2474135.1 MFS transporter [Candidatus Omnitrophota bacterium]
MDKLSLNRALNFSIIDGALSAVMGSLAGGMFLMGFALKVLKAEVSQIGLLAALPMFANLIQIFGSYIIEKTGKKKLFCFICVGLSRLLWIAIIMLPMAIFSSFSDWRVLVLVIVIAASSLLSSLSGVAWLAWMSDLVPENVRGTYFGKRNMIASACGAVVILAAGKFLTLWGSRFGEDNPYSYIIIFSLGLAVGLLSTWFLIRIPEAESAIQTPKNSIDFSLFLKPLKNHNFFRLIIYVSCWIFGVQLAAPFYGVFMISNLKIDFSTITIFGTFAMLATLLMMKIWGPISDKLGNKPIIIVSGLILATIPLLWIVALPKNYYLPIMIAHLLTGAFMAGASLSQFNILIKLSPREGRSAYLALFAAITGIIGGTAPIIGGWLSQIFESFHFMIFAYQVSNLHMIFLISAVIQVLTLFFILKVSEPQASTPMAVIMQLKNDLNPQTGIASTTDFFIIEMKKTENILKKVDQYTEEIAEKSEKQIEKIIKKGEQIAEKPLKKLKDFLKDDD